MDGGLDGTFGHFVEADALGFGFVKPKHLHEVPGNGFALTVRVGRKVDGLGGLGFLFHLFDERAFAADIDVFRREIVFDIDAERAFGQVADMTDRCDDFEVLSQIAFDSLDFIGRFEDYEFICHNSLLYSIRKNERLFGKYAIYAMCILFFL